jgi:outer membrane protein OmpA-like peptidoglycan-associated protein
MMNKVWIVLVFGLGLFLSTDVFAQADAANCKDHSLFPSRMPDYRIEACKIEDFGRYEFYAVKGPKTPAEGRFTFITYAYTGAKGAEPSGLAVVRNYENAITSVDGEVLQSDPNRWINGKITKDGLEVWAQVEKGNGKIWLRIIEKKAMEQHITADAAALGNDIRSTGHVAVYGINFDTAKSTIKPESAQAIAEIGKLLMADPGLKVFVVGHTDNVGSVDSNMKLSQDRAEAVLQSLVKDHGIAADRLRAAGCGAFAPVATNDTEEGRAKNRRVELVKQ